MAESEIRDNHDFCVECGKLVGSNADCENCRRCPPQGERLLASKRPLGSIGGIGVGLSPPSKEVL